MQQPLIFEQNQGQTAEEVTFLSRGRGYTLFLTQDEAVLRLVAEAPRRGAELPEARQPCAALEPEALVNSHLSPPYPNATAPEESCEGRVLRMRLVGAKALPEVQGEALLGGKAHYFIGNDASRWRTNIPTFARVRFGEVYEGIDLVYYGNEGRLEYDFVVAPGADPNQIALEFDGAEHLEIARNGDLVLTVRGREVRWQKPFIYQEVNGTRMEIAGRYRVQAAENGPFSVAALLSSERGRPTVPSVRFVSFELASYNPALPLVIDPILLYSTYLGGSARDSARAVAVDRSGNAFVAGTTSSLDFPTRVPRLGTMAGGDLDLFVAKFNPQGELLFSTYLGGTGTDGKLGDLKVAASSEGRCLVVGTTDSIDFPVVKAWQENYGGGGNDAFVTSLAPDGSELVFSTYLGGSDFDQGRSLALGSKGDIFITGATHSFDFPVTENAFQPELSPLANGEFSQRDAFLVRIAPDASSFIYSTFYGRSSTIDTGWDVTVDVDDNVYFTSMVGCYVGDCSEVVLVKLSANGNQRLFEKQVRAGTGTIVSSPYLALGRNGRVVLVCTTNYRALPGRIRPPAASPGYSDAYLASFDATSGAFVVGRYLGGSGNDYPTFVSFDSNRDLVVVGETSGPGFAPSGFPVTDPFEPLVSGASLDIFVTKLRPEDLEVTYSTVLGGPQNDFPGRAATSADDRVFIPGDTRGDFPSVKAQQPMVAGEEDAFLLKFSFGEKIRIRRSGQTVILSWPAELTNYLLEAAESPGAETWRTITETAVVSGTDRSVELPVTAHARFFRLRMP